MCIPSSRQLNKYKISGPVDKLKKNDFLYVYTYYINCRRLLFMMGIQNGQIQIIILDIDSMIPENHLLRQIKSKRQAYGLTFTH